MHFDNYNIHERQLMATIVSKLHRGNHYGNNGVPMEAASSMGIPVEDRGLAKKLIEDLANADDEPVEWVTTGASVGLEHDRHQVALLIARLGGSNAVPWDLKDHLE